MDIGSISTQASRQVDLETKLTIPLLADGKTCLPLPTGLTALYKEKP